MLLASVN